MIQTFNHTIKLMEPNLNVDTSTATLHWIQSIHKMWVSKWITSLTESSEKNASLSLVTVLIFSCQEKDRSCQHNTVAQATSHAARNFSTLRKKSYYRNFQMLFRLFGPSVVYSSNDALGSDVAYQPRTSAHSQPRNELLLGCSRFCLSTINCVLPVLHGLWGKRK